MKLIAGVDIGNSTTEICIASFSDEGKINFISDSSVATTGIKGTIDNVIGIIQALEDALVKINNNINDLSLIRINEAAPVVSGTALETITETIITESSMIGHNPDTPGGCGVGRGEIIFANDISNACKDKDYIVVFPKQYSYEYAARLINNSDISIKGAVMQADEGVLAANRINKVLPIIDEVKYIYRIPNGAEAAVEVVPAGQTVRMLSNPYGIATLFNLSPDQTKRIVPIAKSLIGKRSGVVIKSNAGEVKERIIPSGELTLVSADKHSTIKVDDGAEKIMLEAEKFDAIDDVLGEEKTNIGNMIYNIKRTMSELTDISICDVKIKDILAVDTLTPVEIKGSQGETCLEKSVGIAAMVKTHSFPMKKIAAHLSQETKVKVEIAGTEAVMAAVGSLTTPGVTLPCAVIDMGGGSTDAAIIYKNGNIVSEHLAGAGEMVTMLIQKELGLSNKHIAEHIKKYPAAFVESLFNIKTETGIVQFLKEPLDPKYFGRVVLLTDNGYLLAEGIGSVEKIVSVRKEAKKKVFLTNVLRALKKISPDGDIKKIPNIVLIGGSAEDFEIPEMLLEQLSSYSITAGRGNIRRSCGARNAVATGLVMSYLSEMTPL